MLITCHSLRAKALVFFEFFLLLLNVITGYHRLYTVVKPSLKISFSGKRLSAESDGLFESDKDVILLIEGFCVRLILCYQTAQVTSDHLKKIPTAHALISAIMTVIMKSTLYIDDTVLKYIQVRSRRF